MDDTAASTLFAWLNREVWLVTASAEGRRGGLIATFVSEASIVNDLPRVLVGLAKQHYTWGLIEPSQAFALHLLSEDNLDLVWRFGLQSAHTIDKFAGLTVTMEATGSPVLAGTIGWLACRVETSMDVGDRTVYLAEVVEGCVTHFAPPLTTRRMLELAPPDKLAELKRLRHLDSDRDAAAIRAWRQGKA
jgi:flavin reductase (DIM6/NTAB) family NADH-FMN oxidoreductase RutF